MNDVRNRKGSGEGSFKDKKQQKGRAEAKKKDDMDDRLGMGKEKQRREIRRRREGDKIMGWGIGERYRGEMKGVEKKAEMEGDCSTK